MSDRVSLCGNGWDVRDAASFDAFVAAAAPRLLRTAVLLTGDRHRGEDLLQDVLARTYLRWRRISDPEAYVRRGPLNAQRSTWRRRRFAEHVTDKVPETGASRDHAEEQAQVDRVARGLSVLTRRERAVVVLRFLEDLSEQQTAQQLDLAVGTVKSTSHRALRKLRSSAHRTYAPSRRPAMNQPDPILDLLADVPPVAPAADLGARARQRAGVLRRRHRLLAGTGVLAVAVAGSLTAAALAGTDQGSVLITTPAAPPTTAAVAGPEQRTFTAEQLITLLTATRPAELSAPERSRDALLFTGSTPNPHRG